MRKMARVVKIVDIQPIPDADKIEVAKFSDDGENVAGWNIVIKKDGFKIGDKAVYFEIDSFIPTTLEQTQFLEEMQGVKRTFSDGKTGYRIKTKKMRGVYSQGLLVNCDEFPGNYEVGDDLTDCLGVEVFDEVAENYIAPALKGEMKGFFPSYIKKTDQERIQNVSKYIQEYRNERFFVTIKLDGTSSTYFVDDNDEFNACSRNVNLKETEENLYWKIAKEYNIEDFVRYINAIFHDRSFAVQGEIIGPRINGGKEKVSRNSFFVYSIYNIKERKYVGWLDVLFMIERYSSERYSENRIPYSTIRDDNFREFAYLRNFDKPIKCKDGTECMPISPVPFKPMSTPFFKEFPTMEKILETAVGNGLVNNNREGIVLHDENHNVSFKVISNKYLEKSE